MDNIEKRFNYYIKNWKTPQIINIPEHAKIFQQNKLIYYTGPHTKAPSNFPYKYCYWEEMFWWNQQFSIDFPCLTISADGIDNCELPAIVKVRYINNTNGGIIGPCGYNRHWGYISHIDGPKTYNKVWDNKISECVWRGLPTGRTNTPSSGSHRIDFSKKWHDKFNVGLSNIFHYHKNYDCYVKGNMSIHEMLDYKYIISIPGNDKDSGLNWKLSSSSLVLMAPPTIESWLMEGLLEPWVHYVPLSEDYSDLDTIIEWCRKNDDKCQEIVKNANIFMKQFEDTETETKIWNMIKEHYIKTFTFV